MIAAAYVTDIDASRALYRLLGFREHSSGKAEASAWSIMQHEGVSVLLASTGPALDIPALPLLFYFFCDDIEAVAGVMEGAGVPVVRTGHPPHALGGEVKMLDPDGNTVLLGQRDRPASRAPAGDKGLIRFSILREAAALVAARGGAPQTCQVTGRGSGRRADRAEVKLADSLGDSVWVCLLHAEDILVIVPAAFIPAMMTAASPPSWPATSQYPQNVLFGRGAVGHADDQAADHIGGSASGYQSGFAKLTAWPPPVTVQRGSGRPVYLYIGASG